MTRYAIVMPAFNEMEGITGFIREILEAFPKETTHVFVIDDCSTDGTAAVLQELARSGMPVTVESNAENLGHGPSTVLALRRGVQADADVIVSVDGDGQFLGREMATLARAVESGIPMVIEGCRLRRSDPRYRRIVSSITRLLVREASGKWPCDANTPLRAYSLSALTQLLRSLPDQTSTPNLMISVLARTQGVQVQEEPVTSQLRRGSSPLGTTWGRSARLLPSPRFMRFCLRALRDWHIFRTQQLVYR